MLLLAQPAAAANLGIGLPGYCQKVDNGGNCKRGLMGGWTLKGEDVRS